MRDENGGYVGQRAKMAGSRVCRVYSLERFPVILTALKKDREKRTEGCSIFIAQTAIELDRQCDVEI